MTTNAKDKKSGRELGADNLQRFDDWIKEHDVAGDWPGYVRGDKLNRSEIAEESGFALSVVRQNPAVKAALVALEGRLRAMGVLERQSTPLAKEDVNGLAVERRIMISKGRIEKRIHKSQGGQFAQGIVPVRGSRLLDQALIYTAVTRGIDQALLIGDDEAILAAIEAPAFAARRHVALPTLLGEARA